MLVIEIAAGIIVAKVILNFFGNLFSAIDWLVDPEAVSPQEHQRR